MNAVEVDESSFKPTPMSEIDPAANFRLIADVPIRLSVQVGSTSMKLADLVELVEGSVVELDRQTHELRVIDVVNADPNIASVERRA